MQSFEPNAAMDNFYNLDDAVRLYVQVMTLWSNIESSFPLNVRYVRYEDMVANFDQKVSAVLSFLDVPWDDSVTRFVESSRGKRISTPSYRQVSQPIYNRAVERWRRYEKHMERHLQQLNPFIERFGYQ